MSDTRVKTIYTSCGSNKTPNVLDWGTNNLICYGAANAICIWDPKATQVICTLCKHTDRVNSVCWIRKCEEDNGPLDILSGSTDKTAILWRNIDGKYIPHVLAGHENGVTVVHGIYVNDVLYLVTASIDSTVKVWIELDGTFSCIQTINFPSGICISLRAHKISINNVDVPLLACSASNSKILLYSGQLNNENRYEFKIIETLVGHEGWINGMDFSTDDNGDILLASCSKDSYIRVWKLKKVDVSADTVENEKGTIQIDKKLITISLNEKAHTFTVSLESVLAGHEGWIYGIHWHPRINGKQPMKLLSSSMDRTIILWSQDPNSELWIDTVRVGEVGGNTLGFYGGKFSPNGNQILGYGYQGSFHLWSFNDVESTWNPDVIVGGHFNEVVDIAWEPQGQFLLSVSTDQTTRLHGLWIPNDDERWQFTSCWHEIARPQVHGYDMSCIAVLSRYQFASGAEEKIIRAFKAPTTFVKNFHNICKIKDDIEGNEIKDSILPKGASVPSLGLSNKAVYESDQKENIESNSKEAYPDTSFFNEIELIEPPTEENLIQNTLWPEVQKLYGHGFELYSMASTSDGQILASASKATKLEHAAILIWDTTEWKLVQKLLSHNLTVTQLSFSPDNNRLLSVSRDRRWSIFQKIEGTKNQFQLIACTDKKSAIHSRIIWCCSWSFDSKYFGTGSRDGKAVIWEADKVVAMKEVNGSILEQKNQSITALSIAPKCINGNYLVAVGFEIGIIVLYKWSLENGWTHWKVLEQENAHHKTVKRLTFRPLSASNNENILYLASCGSDHMVRIFEINVSEL
ncbi:probable elongator complex protein 2 [Chrysoperla carnea]|uniref:probable elongator complex protein 2 n=1 Tax=Chrysoperla carnea TaxID=189513 RepID=UPI001D0955FD|nr:probable elongator complex protein 2 [Chrysoperla carnea]